MPERTKDGLLRGMRGALACFLALLITEVVPAADDLQEKTQEMPKPQGQSQSGGASTGGVFAPVLDEKHRPITAGGFVDGAPIIFEDATKKAGLDKFKHVSGTPEKSLILEAPGSGVAIFDYDNDGWPDIYLVNGSTFDALRGKEKPAHAALFRNNHDGTFTDVTNAAGVAVSGAKPIWSTGATFGDYDGDGKLDLYITGYMKFDLDNPPLSGTS